MTAAVSVARSYFRFDRLTSASSEAAVSMNSCISGSFGDRPFPTLLPVVVLATTARNRWAARSTCAQTLSLSFVTDSPEASRDVISIRRKTRAYGLWGIAARLTAGP